MSFKGNSSKEDGKEDVKFLAQKAIAFCPMQNSKSGETVTWFPIVSKRICLHFFHN